MKFGFIMEKVERKFIINLLPVRDNRFNKELKE